MRTVVHYSEGIAMTSHPQQVTPPIAEFAPLERLFGARRLAVIGASADTDKIGGRPLRYLQAAGFDGEVFPVNPRYDEILGRRCYPSVADINQPIDLAIVAVPGPAVDAAIDDCAAAGVPFAIVFSSGFGETGEEGRRRQQLLVDRARHGGVRLVGPNSLGIASSPNGLMASFATLFDRHSTLLPGTVGFISQSGALGVFIYAIAQDDGLGFSRFVSIGNEADLDVADFLAYMARDPHTNAIGGYLEGLSDGRRFLAAADLARVAGKPMSFLKVGRSEAGRRAAESHTGSLAGSDAVYDAAFRQAGIVRADDPQALIDFLRVQGAPVVRPARRGVAVLTISGGAGVWAADRLSDLGVGLAELTQPTRDRLRAALPPFAAPQNPIDATGQIVNDPGMFAACLDAVLADPDVGTLLLVLGLQERGGERFAHQILEAQDRHPGTAIIVAWLAGPTAAETLLTAASIPVFGDLARAVEVTARSILANEALDACAAEDSGRSYLLEPTKTDRMCVDTEYDAKRVLSEMQIAVPRHELCTSAEAACAAAARLAGPVAMKAQVAGVAHKTEHRLVSLGVHGADAVAAEYRSLEAAAAALVADQPSGFRGVLVEEMAPKGVDVIVGCITDEVFGPTVMFGLGGVLVELMEDVSFRVAPVSVEQALEMIDETRGGRMLDGFRGGAQGDRRAVAEVLSRVSQFAAAHHDVVKEIEINPVRAHPGGAVALDALIIEHEVTT